MVERMLMEHHTIEVETTPLQSQEFRFYGQFDPPVDKFLFERYFKEFIRPGIVIECGAFDGTLESSCRFFEETLGWRAINIEASPTIYHELIKNRPASQNLNYALSNHIGEAEFVDVNFPGYSLCTNGSLLHLQAHREWLDSANCTYSTSRVPTITYRHLVSQLQLKHIDLMVLDIEGHELKALEGFTECDVLPEVLVVEHGHLGVEAIRDVVEQLGYELDVTQAVNSYYRRLHGTSI
jgi:FkbM family methyltransferase